MPTATADVSEIHVVGLGVAQVAALGAAATRALEASSTVIGSKRQLATIAHYLRDSGVATIETPPLAELATLIRACKGQPIVVLASGDPLFYGIGSWICQNFPLASVQFYPAISSIQVLCSRLGIALQDIDVLSLHGRPIEKIRTQLKRHKRLVVLTDQNSTPQRLARECIAAGFAQSTITVCEALGYAHERINTWQVDALAVADTAFDRLHISYLQVVGDGGVLPEFPGIPDHHFATGAAPGTGMISKREVRLAILSLLQVSAHDVVWDIGAGCGSVAVELALWNPQAAVYAIEFHRERLAFLHDNRSHFGVVENLHIVPGRAPQALADLPAPNKVFVGGSDGELDALLVQLWALLPPGGVVAASCVAAGTRQSLQRFAATLLPQAVDSVEIGIRRGELVDGDFCYRAKLPVEIFKFQKAIN